MKEQQPMHLKERELKDPCDLGRILSEGKYATIALCRENEPYIVTLSYGYDQAQRALYFHTAPTGLKLEFIQANPHVCATIIQDRGYRMGECEHPYRSVVIHGQMSVVMDRTEKIHGMRTMLYHLEPNPQTKEERYLSSRRFLEETLVLKLVIEHITGKEGQ